MFIKIVCCLTFCISQSSLVMASENKEILSAELAFSFPIKADFSEDSAGSIIAANLDGADDFELIITKRNYLAAYKLDGRMLWEKDVDICVGGQAEKEGLPGHHAPGVQAADINDDGKVEVLFLDRSNHLYILDGISGKELFKIVLPPPPEDAEKWEHLAVANFRGEGDKDLLLQATNAKGYRMGRYLAAYVIDELIKGGSNYLWKRDDFLPAAHSGARIADINGDGKDEVLGGTIIDHNGKIIASIQIEGHIDGVYVDDVRPDLKGLEVVILEEEGNRVFLIGSTGLVWTAHNNHQEPHNAIIGNFAGDARTMQIWCRSRYDEHQKPFVFDGYGKLLNQYDMDKVAPKDWTPKGMEEIYPIYWDDTGKTYGCAKERHKAGDICIFDPLTGKFLLVIKENASRLYVADVLGDWREEIIVCANKKIDIYTNSSQNNNPHRERFWNKRHYLKSKTIWNYYCP